MTTLAYVFILTAGLIIRGVTKGRGITELPGDLSAMFTALVTSDQSALSEVLARTGEGNTPAVSAATAEAPTGAAPAGGGGLLAAAQALGTAAGNKYVYGAAGPNAYDCSGLVWAAMKKANGFTGLRFTTFTFRVSAAKLITQTTTPQPGDVVLWTSHMGVVDGPGTMYSALNAKYGILHSPISWGGKGAAPTYWRVGTPGTQTGRATIAGTTTRTNVPV